MHAFGMQNSISSLIEVAPKAP